MDVEASSEEWPQLRARLHDRWPALSEDELDETEGDRDALVALLEARYGYARANAEADLDLVTSASVSGPFIATNSADADAVANSGTIDRPLEQSLELSTGVTSHYLEWPHVGASTMLLLHGLGGCAADWQRVAAHFQPRFRVIALDQRGHGESLVPSADYAADRYVADIQAFLETFDEDLGELILVGHAMGGHHALAYAATNPVRVSAVVVSSLDADTMDPVQGMAGRLLSSAQEYVDAIRLAAPSAPDWALWSLAGGRLREDPDGLRLRVDPDAVLAWEPPKVDAQIDLPVLIIEEEGRVPGDRTANSLWLANAELGHLPAGRDPFIYSRASLLDCHRPVPGCSCTYPESPAALSAQRSVVPRSKHNLPSTPDWCDWRHVRQRSAHGPLSESTRRGSRAPSNYKDALVAPNKSGLLGLGELVTSQRRRGCCRNGAVRLRRHSAPLSSSQLGRGH